MTYAGRLDPMASGKLLVLLGDECRRRDKYLGLDKEYEIEVLLDLSTDTGDVLGMPAYAGTETHPAKIAVRNALKKEVGMKRVPYPAFSSKTVNGKPLFTYALEGALDTIAIPEHDERVYRIALLGMERMPTDALKERIDALLALAPRTDSESKELGADFRQDAIRVAWNETLSGVKERDFAILRLRVICSSGTYMRTLAGRIAATLGTTGLALSIHRTWIGRLRFGIKVGT